jgi:hypothetical protein
MASLPARTKGDNTMSGHVITATNPVVPRWRRRSFAALALSVLLVATAGVVVRVVSSDSSTASHPATHPAAVPVSPATVPSASPAQLSNVCTGPSNLDGAVLLAVLASMPSGTAAQVTAALSPQARQKIEQAALTAGVTTGSVPSTPDGLDLRGVLARSSPADQQLVLTALSPNARASVGIEFDAASLPMEFQPAFAGVTGVPIPTCP